jgi:predicted transcriptional regulator
MSDESDNESEDDEWESLGTYKVENPDWLTEMDIQILDALARGLTLTPSIIADNTDRSRAGVSQRLSTLQAAGYVEKIDRGKYEITEEGMEFLSGRLLNPEKLWQFDEEDAQDEEES